MMLVLFAVLLITQLYLRSKLGLAVLTTLRSSPRHTSTLAPEDPWLPRLSVKVATFGWCVQVPGVSPVSCTEYGIRIGLVWLTSNWPLGPGPGSCPARE